MMGIVGKMLVGSSRMGAMCLLDRRSKARYVGCRIILSVLRSRLTAETSVGFCRTQSVVSMAFEAHGRRTKYVFLADLHIIESELIRDSFLMCSVDSVLGTPMLLQLDSSSSSILNLSSSHFHRKLDPIS